MNKTEQKQGRGRVVVLALLLCVFVAAYVIRLFQIQIVNGDEYAAEVYSGSRTKLPVAATRGEILDCNLTPLVVNTTSYTVTLDYNYFPHGSSEESLARQNEILKGLCDILTAAGEKWNDTMPLSKTAPYTFVKGREAAADALKTDLRLAVYATADNCMAAMIDKYGLAAYDETTARWLAGIHWEMETREFSASNPFTFAQNVSKETFYLVGERSTEFPGVSVELTPERKYLTGTHAAHILGTVGLLSDDEYEKLKNSGYSYNDVIGKNGVEQAMESALRGQNGERTLRKDADGKVVSEEETLAPVPGSAVALTIDMTLQKKVEAALDETVKEMRGQPAGYDGQDISSGAAVVLDVRDNSVKAIASWPPFDITRYYEDYGKLLNDPDNPLFNRALDGGFAPGSTMKPAMAIGALNEGLITKNYTYYCGSWYRHYENEGLMIHCMANHGNCNVVYGIGKSCNAFFCEMGRLLGIERMNDYCRQLGLGVKTGIEIGESAGTLAGPDEREEAGGVWVPADSSQAAIGQSDNMITPVQLATYVSTIANRGTRYKTHLVSAVLGYDGTVQKTEKEVACQMDVRADVWDTLKEGMLLTAHDGTATRFFVGVDYEFAAKTGTAEAGNGGSDHGVFIGYAPADSTPRYAVAVVMENGTATGSGRLARKVMDACFAVDATGKEDTPQGVLLP